MTAHVAEARENSGRVLIWLDPAAPCSPSAFTAATRLASAFDAFVETVVIGEHDISEDSYVPTRRIVSGVSGPGPSLNVHSQSARSQRRLVNDTARQAGVLVRHTNQPGIAIDRLDTMCREDGPWNIIVLGRAPGVRTSETVSSILANVNGATAVLVAGIHQAPGRSDDVIVVIEDVERMPSLLRAAERLRQTDGRLKILVAADTRAKCEVLEQSIRLIPDHIGFSFEPPVVTFSSDSGTENALCRLKGGYVVARFGGTFVPGGRGIDRALAVSRSPFLLVR